MNLTASISKLIPVLILFLTTVPATAQQAAFEELIERFNTGEIFYADFTHQYVDSYTGDSVSNGGTIWVGENKYKVRTQHQLIVVDGETSRVYDSRRNRVIISTYEPEEDDFAPSRILNGADSTYVIEDEQQKNGQILITLMSEDPFAVFQKVDITLNSKFIPLRIFALDQAANRITTTFKKGTFISSRKGMFVLEYPDDAEIIGMRDQKK